MFTINATIRTEQGKGASRRLRHADKLPAIVYGGSESPIAIELEHNQIINMQAKPEFYTEVLTLDIEGKQVNVKVKAMQRHVYKPKVTHIDFIRV